MVSKRHRDTSENLAPENLIIDDHDKGILQVEKLRITEYIKSKQKTIKIQDIHEHKAGIVFAEQYVYELGHKLLDLNYEIDIVVMIDLSKRKISFRSRAGEVDVSEIAKHYNGGGHTSAAGCEISLETSKEILNIILG